MELIYTPAARQLADTFKKPLKRVLLENCFGKLMSHTAIDEHGNQHEARSRSSMISMLVLSFVLYMLYVHGVWGRLGARTGRGCGCSTMTKTSCSTSQREGGGGGLNELLVDLLL